MLFCAHLESSLALTMLLACAALPQPLLFGFVQGKMLEQS